jgi:hypothetical protein
MLPSRPHNPEIEVFRRFYADFYALTARVFLQLEIRASYKKKKQRKEGSRKYKD